MSDLAAGRPIVDAMDLDEDSGPTLEIPLNEQAEYKVDYHATKEQLEDLYHLAPKDDTRSQSALPILLQPDPLLRMLPFFQSQ